jgi:flagellar basal body-associated protein FliL
MGLFSFFKPPKPVGFDYHPRFFDPKKEEFQERLRSAREKAGDHPEAVKSRIRSSLQRKTGYLSDRQFRQQQVVKSNLRLLIIIVVLILLAFVAIEIYLPRIVQFLE